MEIEIGNSLPVLQKPYNLPWKHIAWVQQELEMLQKQESLKVMCGLQEP